MASSSPTRQATGESARREDERQRALRRGCIEAVAVAALLTTCVGVWPVGFLLFFLGGSPSDDYERLTTLDCGEDRRVVLWVLTPWEPGGQFLCYQVFDGDREVVPRWPIYELWDYTDGIEHDITKLHYSLVASRDGQLVGVVPRELPYTIVCLHDFSTGESWPHLGPTQTWAERAEKRRRLRERLEADHPAISPMAKTEDKAYLAEVRSLDLSDSHVTDEHLANLRGLADVRSLHLDGTDISDAGLEYLVDLPNLKHLNLADTVITDSGLKTLGKMKQLHGGWVDVSGTDVTAEGVAALRSSLPSTQVWWKD